MSTPGQGRRRALRIAFVLAHLGRGGTETQARLLIEACARRGLDVSVFVLSHQPDWAELEPANVPVTYLDRVRTGRSAVGLAPAAIRLRGALARGRFDVVHAVLARAHVLAPLLAPRSTTVVGWRRNLGDHLQRRTPALWAERLAARRTDAIVANSPPVAEYWARCLGLPLTEVPVVPNALEDWRFERVPPRQVGPEPLVVTVGGLRPVKGHALLVDAMSIVRRTRPVRLAIVGDGPLRNDLTEHARRAGVPIELPGHVADPRPWLGAAAVYAHPSLSEGSSNAILEAMAYGCPVVATDTGDSASTLDGCGVVAEPDDAEALAAAIDRLLEDDALARGLGATARLRARERFGVERMVSDHIDLYERLVSCGRA